MAPWSRSLPAAGGRRRGDGGDQPAARDPRRPAGARARRQRRRRSPRRGRGPLRHRADVDRRRRRCSSHSSGTASSSTGSTPPGRPRSRADPESPVEETGPRSVTVPGAVAGWAALAERFGRLGLDAALEDAIAAAEGGFAVGAVTADGWIRSAAPTEFLPAPSVGSVVRLPELGATLRRIAGEGPDADLPGRRRRRNRRVHVARRGGPRRLRAALGRAAHASTTADVTVCELPPPTQGVAALEGLGLLAPRRALAGGTGGVRAPRARRTRSQRVRDGADVADLLEPGLPRATPPGLRRRR